MKNILIRYEAISRHAINFNKSSVTFSPSTTPANRQLVCTNLQVQEVQVPGKYLGMPMSIGRDCLSVSGFLVNLVDQKFQNWSHQVLSKAGKLILLKTATQIIPNFWINLLLIPNEVIDRLEKRMNSFWWGSGRGNKRIK